MCIGIGDGTATWAVTNSGNIACSCLCSCCHRGQSCGCIVELIFILSVSVGSVDLSEADNSIKLEEGVLLAVGSVGEMSCDGTSSLLLVLSSSGRRADCLVPVLFGVRLRGTCMGLYV